MNHRQRMIIAEKVESMLKNKTYSKFPEECARFAHLAGNALKKDGCYNDWEQNKSGEWYIRKERSYGWVYDRVYLLYRKSFTSLTGLP